MNTPVLLQCTNQHHPTIYNFSIWWFQPIFQNITQIGSSPYRSGLNINNVWNHLYQVKVEFMLIFMVNVDKYTSPMDPMGQVPNADFFFPACRGPQVSNKWCTTLGHDQHLWPQNLWRFGVFSLGCSWQEVDIQGFNLTFKDSIWRKWLFLVNFKYISSVLLLMVQRSQTTTWDV